MKMKVTMKKYYLIMFCGLFIALQIVLRRITNIDFGFVRVNLEFVAVALGGAILGPLWNGLICAASDIIGFLMVPGQGAFFPGYTLSALLKGMAYGFFLKSALPGFSHMEHNQPLSETRPLSTTQPLSTTRPLSTTQPLSETRPRSVNNPQSANRPLSTTRSLLVRASLAAFTVTFPIEAFLNTLWVAMLYNEAYSFYLGARLIKSAIMLPLHVLAFAAIWRPLRKYIESAVMPKLSPAKN
jgi:ECF transporter S component (folate family)